MALHNLYKYKFGKIVSQSRHDDISRSHLTKFCLKLYTCICNNHIKKNTMPQEICLAKIGMVKS